MTSLKPSRVGGALIFLMFAAGFWAQARLPATAPVPIHFDFSGTPDRWAPAYIGLFLLPAILTGVWLLPIVLPRIDPRGGNLLRSGRAFGTILLATTVVVAAAQGLVVSEAIGIRFDTTRWVGVLSGFLLIVVGNVFGKLRWNYTVGIRTPWTLADEWVWDRTHRFGGWVFVIGGVAALLLSWLLPARATPVMLVCLMVATVVLPIGKSYLLWRQQRKKEVLF
jgi:uncharacterized membrane protein